MSKSPPNNLVGPNDMSPHARRESISWAANQLHISGNESDENHSRQPDGVDSPLRPSIVRRTVTRRHNLLVGAPLPALSQPTLTSRQPKTKGFARIRAALAEESAPVESEFLREAEVVRQVRESDMDLEPRHAPPLSTASTALSSPNLATHDTLEEIADEMMVMDPSASALGVAGAFKQQALKKGKVYWDTFSDTSSTGAPQRVTPPPPSFGLARASSSGFSMEDVSMGSPSASSNGGASQSNPFVMPGGTQTTTRSSSGNGTPLGPPTHGIINNYNNSNNFHHMNSTNSSQGAPTVGGVGPMGIPPIPGPPTAAEITRRINSKRRRGDDDLDPVSIKRRAVSPGMSVHNSPVMQSPLQRDTAPWGNTVGLAGGGNSAGLSRPGSVGGDSAVGVGGKNGNGSGGGSSESGSVHAGSGSGNNSRGGGKVRVGFQGMVETNDGITRLSIE